MLSMWDKSAPGPRERQGIALYSGSRTEEGGDCEGQGLNRKPLEASLEPGGACVNTGL